MRKYQEYLQDSNPSDEQPQSGLDFVKSLLKGAAITTAAGMLGGDTGVKIAGGAAAQWNAQNRQRKLDKIANVKSRIEADKDIAAINANEASIEHAKNSLEEQIRKNKADEFNQQIDRTNRNQEHLGELKLRLQDSAAERTLKRDEIRQRKADIVAETRRKLQESQDAKTKRGIGQITGAMSQMPLDPASDSYEKDAAEKANGIAQAFRVNLGVKTKDQAERSFDTLLAQGQLSIVDSRLVPVIRERISQIFKAEEEFNREQNRIKAGLPASGQMPAPSAGLINDTINAVPDGVIDSLAANNRIYNKGGRTYGSGR